MWWDSGMTLFAGRARQNLVRWLKRGDVRLLLPADPGPERMLECVRLFDPRAKPVSHGAVNVDGMREVNLSRAYPIDPELAAEAGIPGEFGAAYFVGKTTRAQPYNWSDVQSKDKEQVDASFRLVRGLAVRLGGLAHPHDQPAVAEPLRATVYTPRQDITVGQVQAMVARHMPGIAPYDDVTLGSIGVSAWRTSDGHTAEFWPVGKTSMMPARVPVAVGDWYYKRSDLGAVHVQLSTPGNKTGPDAARRLGECALAVARATNGVCTDQLGFRVTRPEDLVFG